MLSSFEEAGEQLFTFLRYPVSQWKALRTTNALERINEEFRRRLGVEVDRTRCVLQSLVGTVDSEAVEATHHRPQFTRFSLLSNQTQRTSPVLARYPTQPMSAQSSWSSRGQRKNAVPGFDCCRGETGSESLPRR